MDEHSSAYQEYCGKGNAELLSEGHYAHHERMSEGEIGEIRDELRAYKEQLARKV